MDKLLTLLNANARIEAAKLAVMLGTTEEEVNRQIAAYEEAGIIRGYKPVIDYSKIDTQFVEAFIELRVTPKRDFGFEEVAAKVSSYHEVESVYLMSGGYDLHVQVVGKTFKEIALFVAQRLAILDGVVSTTTHFVLSRYKDRDIMMIESPQDERGNVSLW
jgi:DNA-binding Lrp family transcriptional regulator